MVQQDVCKQVDILLLKNQPLQIMYLKHHVPYSRKVWRIDSFQAFGERKFGELIDQPIDY